MLGARQSVSEALRNLVSSNEIYNLMIKTRPKKNEKILDLIPPHFE